MQPEQKDLVTGVISAAVGAGVAVSFAVAFGQSPWIAMGITAFSAGVALLVDRTGLM
ncbi:MAG: hypothetical protein VKL01_11175 [Limnothrix sp.]|jgi:uncharacterized membrane protein YgaE (UPF0421/DUF939 family)|uniref:Uncharacterized protein n=1 Tax=Limnothrix redekei LRLZ20PSL1 TaxID=3112953 RepID=A0ABW7CCT8_9CYAN|nr:MULTISPECIES: hypothetical protein [unclassified Limnothrix]MEB3118917.1 hypothetical protein [Limnothrix sp.]MBD2162034.1 hypothetical protein [Limnothrix sp. FACHB-1083]MBD2192926.1 hypothetical protein [Limnothrix sp. FACHB-1088]MBD2554253.1 hypothetical protein [Limnothrix sp. FACHB-708]MBD2591393.1 hypothetical protein [Limnothrix sp. FACHB-406]